MRTHKDSKKTKVVYPPFPGMGLHGWPQPYLSKQAATFILFFMALQNRGGAEHYRYGVPPLPCLGVMK
jgi:hypothetical protein